MSQYIEITRVFDAPRDLVYRAFTDPDRLARWFAAGCWVPRDNIWVDARPGGHLRFVSPFRRAAPNSDHPFMRGFGHSGQRQA